MARPVGPGARLGRWCRRNPALATASGLALLAVAATVLVSALYLVGNEQTSKRVAIADAEKASALKEADRQKAVAALERGHSEYRDGQASRGLLHILEGLRLAQLSGDRDLERGARASISTYRAEVHTLQNVLIGAVPVDGRRWGRVALTRDGRFALIASFDGTARLFEPGSGRAIGTPLVLGGSGAIPSAITVSADGKTAAFSSFPVEKATGDQSKVPNARTRVSIWDLTSGKLLSEPATKNPEGLVSIISALDFSPDGKTLLTGSADHAGESGEARLWDASSCQALTPPLKTAHGVTSGAFSPDGRSVAIGDGNMAGKGTISIWDVPVPTSEDIEYLQLKAQVETGLEMSKAGEIRVMNPETWLERKDRLLETPASKTRAR